MVVGPILICAPNQEGGGERVYHHQLVVCLPAPFSTCYDDEQPRSAEEFDRVVPPPHCRADFNGSSLDRQQLHNEKR